MGLFSSLQEALNSDIVYKFNSLYDNHYRGTKFFYEYATRISPGNFGIYPREWHPTPVLLPGKSHGRKSLVRRSPWDR